MPDHTGEFLPCPFCGSDRIYMGHWERYHGRRQFYVFCRSCETMGPVANGWEAAKVKWNRRDDDGAP